MKNAFIEFLEAQRKGCLLPEIDEEFRNLVKACQDTGKVGDITLHIKIKPVGETVTASDQIKTKVPQLEKGASSYFVCGDGSLSRNNPRQDELPLPIPVQAAPAINPVTPIRKV